MKKVNLVLAAVLMYSGFASATILIPSDDAYVRDDTLDTTYNEEQLITWTHYGAATGRSYIKFSMAGLPQLSQLQSATLNMYLWEVGGYLETVSIYYAKDDSWIETSLNWNNAPGTGDLVASENVGSYYTWGGPKWVSFDLLASGLWDYDSDRSDGYVTFVIKTAENGEDIHRFYSKEENVPGDFAPYLEVIAIPEPTTMAILVLGGLMIRRRS
ncbi:MAG: PEP-CTERM sorting domain-containing protein [Pirellulales bacterium]|nr:PEP-CTERM sorting domain-containing protein [Pirellulales bacterium]